MTEQIDPNDPSGNHINMSFIIKLPGIVMTLTYLFASQKSLALSLLGWIPYRSRLLGWIPYRSSSIHKRMSFWTSNPKSNTKNTHLPLWLPWRYLRLVSTNTSLGVDAWVLSSSSFEENTTNHHKKTNTKERWLRNSMKKVIINIYVFYNQIIVMTLTHLFASQKTLVPQ